MGYLLSSLLGWYNLKGNIHALYFASIVNGIIFSTYKFSLSMWFGEQMIKETGIHEA